MRAARVLGVMNSATGAGHVVSTRQAVRFLPRRAHLDISSPAMDEFEPDKLIARIAEHQDREAFGRLFAHYAPRVKTFVRARGVAPERAEELAQETLLRLWRKAHQFDASRATASAWVYSIARNLFIDEMRRGVRDRRLEQEEEPAPEGPERPDDLLMAAERERLVREVMAGLPGEQLKVVRLSFFDGLAHSEIAERLGLPLGTVKSRIRLAVARLREQLGEMT